MPFRAKRGGCEWHFAHRGYLGLARVTDSDAQNYNGGNSQAYAGEQVSQPPHAPLPKLVRKQVFSALEQLTSISGSQL